MSVTGISTTSLYDFSPQNVQDRTKQFRQEFQQLGEDLQSGNLSAAQADFKMLQQLGPQGNATSGTQNNNPIAQDFKQLATDLQSGNISAAQQDYSKIQQDLQSQAPQMHHHHHHRGGGGASGVGQLLQQLGQALDSGNLSAAQQAYTSLQQDFQQFAQSSNATTGSSNISVNA
ncbi:MAG TPA: hypothetical protein VMT53_01040 [Terriglobales bacterium]|nr:hypothetical protein [Terriglobales bacterium]